MRKIVLFRISSKGNPKVKVDYVNKYDCLDNLLKVFAGWEFICVADNCDDMLVANLKNKPFHLFYETNLGNPGSFWRLYEIALKSIKDDDVLYFWKTIIGICKMHLVRFLKASLISIT